MSMRYTKRDVELNKMCVNTMGLDGWSPVTMYPGYSALASCHVLDCSDTVQPDNGFMAFANSKLQLAASTRELSRRLRGSGVDVLAANPGFVASRLYSKGPPERPEARVFDLLEEWVAQHPYHGATSILYAASHPNLQGKSSTALTMVY